MNLVMHPLKTTFVQKTWLGRDKVQKYGYNYMHCDS